MRPVCLAAFTIAASSLFLPSALLGQINPSNLTITNYQLVGQPIAYTQTQYYYTYSASLINTGPALPGITATVTSRLSSGIVVPGKGNLHFPASVTNQVVDSLNTFTILVDRTAIFGFNALSWSFNAPVANAGTAQTATVGSTVTLNGSGSTNPSGIGTLTYGWALTTVPSGSGATLTNPSSVTPTFVPDMQGNYIVTLTVNNGSGSDTATVAVNVNSGSPQPVANAGPNQMVAVGATVYLDGSHSQDFNNHTLSYSWTLVQRPAGSTATLANANTVSPSFVADVATTASTAYVAQLVVNDGFQNSAPSTVTITTTPTSPPPVANAGSPQTVVAGTTVQLDGSGSSDSNGHALSYNWSLITLPPGSNARLGNPASVDPTFVADLAGQYVAQLIVNDGVQNSLPSTVMITANPATNPQPVANAGPNQTVQIGAANATPVMLSGSGTDPNGHALTYHWTLATAPGSSAVLSNANISNPTFTPDKIGQYTATLIVNNGSLNSLPSQAVITVVDSLPIANAGTPENVIIGSTVTLNGLGSSDSNNAPLQYSWSLLTVPPNSTAVLTAANTASPSFVADLGGSYVAQLIVNDGIQNSVPATVLITASPQNSISLSPNPLNIIANGTGTLTVTLGAPAGPLGQTVRLTVVDPTVASAPQTVMIPANSATATATITGLMTGSTNIFGSAPGFQPALADINVVPASISLTLGSSIVGVGNTVNGTVTLNAPAPNNGLNVGLSLSPNGYISLSTMTVNIPSGMTTGTFTITGGPAAGGPTTITASANGWTSSQASITSVTQGSITVPSGVTVAPGQSMGLNVTIGPTAAVNPVTITLMSSDTTKLTVTPSIVIPAGSIAATTEAMVTGVNFGSATITATATGYVTGSATVNVAANLSFSPQTVTLGTGGSTNLTLTLSPGSAPAGGISITLASDNPNFATVQPTAMIQANQNTATITVNGVGAGTAHITASSSVTGIASGSATVNVIAGVTISSTALPNGVVGAAYTASETASGGSAPYTFSATALPAGLSINSSTGQITGTPTTATGSAVPVTITVTDSTSPTHLTASTTGLTITINPALTITSAALPNGAVGATYTASETASGGTGPYTYSATGLPAGLSINSSTGQITGTPTTATGGAVPVTITVTDSTSPTHLTASTTGLTITVAAGLTISNTPLPNGVVGAAYTASETASGGTTPYTYSATGLPAGLSINSSSGQITGTPAAATSGAVPVTITATDSTSPTHLTASTTGLTITVGTGLAISNTALPNGVVGISYTASETASGGTTPYNYSATGLPAGLSINSSTGQITGTPTTATSGAVPVTITATDSTSPTHLTASTSGLTITIAAALTITNTALPNGVVGAAYTASETASGGTTPYTYSATGLPAGLSINSSTGQITGTPTAATSGAVPVTITVTDSTSPTHLTASTSGLTITVGTGLAISNTALPNGVVGGSYAASETASGGTTPYTYSATGLPAGLSINSSTGQITGTPTAATSGAVPVTITATDSTSPTHLTASTSGLTITIGAGLTISNTALPNGVVGGAYTASETASGGTTPYTYSATGLPAGLSINSSTGQITGTPTAATSGAVPVTITATDSTSPTHLTASTSGLTITIGAGLTISNTPLPNGVVGAAYTASETASGGTTPYIYSATGLPAGLSINSSTGQITGAPTAATSGAVPVTITATDSTSPTHLTASTSGLTITVGTGLAISNTVLPNGVVGISYTASETASGGTTPYTYSATGLPAGLSINSSTGHITGMPTVATSGAVPVTITATDSTSPTHETASTSGLTITINPTLSISNTALPNGVVGGGYTASETASGGTTPYTYSATGLPAGLSINSSTGQITGTPTTATSGAAPVTITVTDSTSPTHLTASTSGLTITIGAGLTISNTALPNGVVGGAYTASETASGGTTPYTYSATGLPAGLSINSSTGQITGTPTAATGGAVPVTVTVTDSTSPTHLTASTSGLTITIRAGLTISNTALPNGVVGGAYTASETASGGTTPYTYSATGLPAGLSINSSTGQITGTPTSATSGAVPVTITATDSTSPTHLTASTSGLTITIGAGLTISNTTLPNGVVGGAYTASETASGGTTPYTYSATGLPAGLSINSSTGQITGTPTAATSAVPVTITATDSTSPTHLTASTSGLTITIGVGLTISNTALPNGVVGSAYTASETASGGTTPYTYSATGLPAGLSINSSTGQINGTPTAATSGAVPVTITATDSTSPTHLTASTSGLTITIRAGLTISNTALPNGVVGGAYTASETASGGTTPYTYSATGLPAGLSINSSTGQITGTPTAATSGAVPVTITATDSTSPTHLTASTSGLTITIGAGLTISNTALPNGVVGGAYTASETASGGTTPYTYSATGLPAGLSINSSTGQINGTPTAATSGAVPVTITATDSTSPSHLTASTSGLTITIGAGLTISNTALPNGVVGSAYTASETASGGTTPYTYSATGLPAGLSINSSTGQITGTPTAATSGAVPVIITATDSTSPTHLTASTSGLTITIGAGLTISNTALPNGVVGGAYTASETASGGTTPYTYSATGLPAGLSINSSTGQITGTPTTSTSGAAPVTITATDSTSPTHLTASTSGLTITIGAGLTISNTALPNGVVGGAYTASETGSGGTTPYTYSATGLPAGLSINSSTGQITGTPTSATSGAAPVTITVRDSTSPTHLTASTTGLTITIGAGLTISNTALPNGVVGSMYTASETASGGTTPYTYSATGLPAGLSINSSTGQITGTPTTATGAAVSVTVTVTDSTSPTHQTASTAGLTITITPPPLSITTTSLTVGMEAAPYSAPVSATGGTTPYTYSATGLPIGLQINSALGVINGTPQLGTAGSYTVAVTVRDSSNPQQTAHASLSLTIAPFSSMFFTVTGGTVGNNLALPLTVTVSPLPGNAVQISSSNPSAVTLATNLACSASNPGPCIPSGTLSIPAVDVAELGTTFTVFAVGAANSGSATITVSSPGYTSGTSTVTAAPSGFVLAGPNGIGGSFTIGQNSGQQLTISTAQLDSSGNIGQMQQVAGGPSVSYGVSLSVANPSLGTVSPSSVTFTSGMTNATAQFTSGTTSVSSTITANEPSGFSTPAASGNALAVTVSNQTLSCQAVAVGNHLENLTSCSLTGAVQSASCVTVTSNDPARLLFSTNGTGAGSASIARSIPAGGSSTAPFYVYGLANSGTVNYSVTLVTGSPTGTPPACPSGSNLSATGSVTLAPSGFVLVSPFGLGVSFPATAGGPQQGITVEAAQLDSSGNYVNTQALAGGVTASVTVTSSNTGVGTISGSPAVIAGPNNSATVEFQGLSSGTSALTATAPSGYTTPAQFATVTANVSQPRLIIDSGNTIGYKLERQGTIILLGATAPSGGLPVTLTVTAGSISLSQTGTDSGSSSIVVTVPGGQSSATYYMYGLSSSGTGTVQATASGYTSGSGTESLTPSGVVIGGLFGPGFPFNTPLSSGNQPLSVSTAQLDASGNFVQVQALAGSTGSIAINLSDSTPGVGTVPSVVFIAPGPTANGTVTATFQPLMTGTTFIGVSQPSGFTMPIDGSNSLTINVQ